MKPTHVQIYDFETEAVNTIPAAELAPGMVEVHIQGREGTYWISPASLKPSPFQPAPNMDAIFRRRIHFKAFSNM